MLIQEIVKLGISLLVLFSKGELNILKGFRVGIWFRFAVLPAALYSVQNVASLQVQHGNCIIFSCVLMTRISPSNVFFNT